jgi:hypothetical protein
MAYRPHRIASPDAVFAAAADLCRAISASARITDDAERDRWYNATTKAVTQLMDGVRIERQGDDFIFPSRSRGGLAHRVNGTCDCEAAVEQRKPCWHRAAKKLVLVIEASEHAALDPEPEPDPQPYHCPRCAAPLHHRTDGAEVYMCCNPRCNFQIAADLMESIDIVH